MVNKSAQYLGHSFHGNNFRDYKNMLLFKSKRSFDELISPEGGARKGVENIAWWLKSNDNEELGTASELAQLAIRQMGNTLYGLF